MKKTKRKIPFFKMQGSGNDFILIDNRRGFLKGRNLKKLAITVCHRRFSVGADGLIVILPSGRVDFKWRYFNSDGSEAEMCGNGSRCAARFAFIKMIAPRKMAFETRAGVIHAEVKQERVKVQLTDAPAPRLNRKIPFAGSSRIGHFINTGVPHLVYLSDNLDAEDVQGTGRKTRHHRLFSPAGTNVNFVQVRDRHRLMIRTFERGVEGETLACGTGAVASALVAASLDRVASPVAVVTRGAETLAISFARRGEAFNDIHLEGEAQIICEGTLYC